MQPQALSGLRLQALFEPLEQLSELRDLVGRLLQPGLTRWQLYTTPPKQVRIKRFAALLCGALFP